jgi:hypothetical protein
VIRQFVKVADPYGFEDFPEDEYARIEILLYKLLRSGTSAECLAKELRRPFCNHSYEEELDIAKQIINWWNKEAESRVSEAKD